MPRPRCALLLPLALLCGACATGKVYVTYPVPKSEAELSSVRALGNAYLLVKLPGRLSEKIPSALRKKLGKVRLLSRRAFEADASAFAEALEDGLAKRGGHILAYRTTDTPERDGFVDVLEPTSVLIVKFDSLVIDRKETERMVRTKDKKTGKTVERKALHWEFHADLGLSARLVSRPDRRILMEKRVRAELTQRLTRRPGTDFPKEKWYGRVQKKLMRKAAAGLAAAFPPVPAVRHPRALHVDKEDPLSKEAAKQAGKGSWERASELWVERLEEGKGGWRELVNLGIAAEKSRAFEEAERLYTKANEAGKEDPEAAKIPWAQFFSDLKKGMEAAGGRSEAAAAWFSAPFAVLPFSDETTSIDGPEMLRKMVQRTLKRGGYNVLPLPAVDRELRMNGFSQGGQLKLGEPSDFARWLGAERLLFGHITEFRDIMLGVYGKRVVAGELSIWDAREKKTTWTADEPAITEEAARSADEAAARFGGQLLRGLGERIIRRPLGAESALFIRRNLETFPLRPRRR